MNEWDQMIARQVEADGVRMASGQHVPDYPNARDCEHGQLRRSCERCEDAQEIAALRAEVERLTRERDESEDARWRITLATTEGETDYDPVPWGNLATGVEHLRNQWIAEFQRADAAEARVASLEAALRDVLRLNQVCLDEEEAILERARAALGDQVAPAEWRRDNLLPPCVSCEGTGSEAHPWDDNCPLAGSHAAPPVEAPAERCPTCVTSDPQECAHDGFVHPHGGIDGCCPDPWHSAPPEGEQG